jgi:glycerophosphoryl diester phosphodiesterase
MPKSLRRPVLLRQSERGLIDPSKSKYALFILLLIFLVAGMGCNALGRPPTPNPESAPRLSDDLRVQLGPRPFYLIDRLRPGPLREKLESCSEGPFRRSRFSIGHRGAPLQFPEHTRESYLAAARMGAGVIECDVAFTSDRELVCRHSQCDLATTTNILETPLAERCSEGFNPAVFDAKTQEWSQTASARCCTSDLTLAEFRQLEGRMDAANPYATTIADFLDATPRWRTDLYANGGTLMSHLESLELFRSLGVAMTPELKSPEVEMPFEGDYEQRDYARQLLEAYRGAGIPPERAFFQSFQPEDIRYWLEIAPEYGARAILLVGEDPSAPTPPQAYFDALYSEGFRTIAPPISLLLQVDEQGDLRASEYAQRARASGLAIVAWSAERSGRIRDGRVEGRERDFYLDPVLPALDDDGDLFRIIDALVHQVGIVRLFSDWPATSTYYANCFGLD